MSAPTLATALVFDGLVHPRVFDYAELFGGCDGSVFERPKEGINTIGGFCTLPPSLGGHTVFVKFLGKPVALKAALVDSLKPLFGLPSNGCVVVHVRLPVGGIDVPWAKRPGAFMNRRGLEWVLITKRLPGVSVTRYLLQASGVDESKYPLNTKTPIYRLLRLPRDQHVVRAITAMLAFRIVFGVGDMGLGNFIFDEASGRVFSVDEGSAFTDSNHPNAGQGGAQRSFLQSNLLCDEFKRLAVQDGQHLCGADFITAQSLDALMRQIHAHVDTFYSAHDPSLTRLLDEYVRPNLLTVKESLETLLCSAGGGGKRAATSTKRPANAVGDMAVSTDKRLATGQADAQVAVVVGGQDE